MMHIDKPTSTGAGKLALLVVEDNPSTLLLFQHVLKSGYEVETATSVDEALGKAAARRFDAFVLDINLCEERDGTDLLRALREQPAYRHVPAVVCTAYTRPVDRERFLAAGFDAYVSKPFTKGQLVEAIQHVLTDAVSRPRALGSASLGQGSL
jgi:CheY-like chemotaxis protein